MKLSQAIISVIAAGTVATMLSGCNLMDVFSSNDSGKKANSPEVYSHHDRRQQNRKRQENPDKPQKPKPAAPRAESPSNVREAPPEPHIVSSNRNTEISSAGQRDLSARTTELRDPVYEKPVASCADNAPAIQNAVRSLARMAINAYQPKQPNLTLVNGFSAGKGICYKGTSLTAILKDELSSSGRYNIMNSQLEKKMRAQQGQASNAFLVRLAKAQNVDYIISGQTMIQREKPVAILRIMSLATGSVVWQRSVPIE
ncbi:hypothetical protein [Succinimonas amylolytica]|uniref:hypothetical protein n=1 Tax=Succinimonas amylolytica TaxID=83769 RepID=UPI00037508C5|nr:hypothetical protein [Succinimonas amylolytica]